MHPTLLELGPLRISSFGFSLLVAFGAGIALLVGEARRDGRDPNEATDLALAAIIGGILGARIGYVAAHWSAFRSEPARLVQFWQDGGLVFLGALAGGLVACLIAAGPASVAQFADLASRPLCLGYAIGMLGALLAGAFNGRPTDVPWAIEVGGVLRHPTQLYLLLTSLAIFRVLRTVRARRAFPGETFLLFLALFGVTRFVVEFFMDPEVAPAALGPFTLAQVANGVVAGAAALLLHLGERSASSGRAPGEDV